MWRQLREWDEPALAEQWRAARPFAHLVIDDVLPVDELAALMEHLEEEPVHPYEAEHFRFEATAVDALGVVRAAMATALAPRLSRITGKAVATTDTRAYSYWPGSYLLPHTDHQEGLARRLAYAYYLPTPDPPRGGELELYACRFDGDDMVETTSATVIEPRSNRLVVFDVCDGSLHQVREVLAGLRISLAGWFYP